MKRTAGTIMLLAGLGGCASPEGAMQSVTGAKPFGQAYQGVETPGVMGPTGEPIPMTRAAAARGAAPGGVRAASGTTVPGDSGVQQAAGFARIGRGATSGDCTTGDCGGGTHIPGIFGGHHGHHGGVDPYAYGPMGHGIGTMLGHNGIMPAPGMGPAGAVAAIGAIGPGMPYGPQATNQRTSIKFVNPQGMKVTWLGPTGYMEPGRTTPASYNFLQGSVYRLRLSGIPNRPGKVYYPTLEISPVTPKTVTFLAHNTVPIAFSDDDLERVNAGNLVVKVIYLPDPMFQDLAAVAGAEEVVSTQLQPGEDPVVEATRRGTVLAIIRLGNIDLEDPNTPAMDAPGAGMMRPTAPPQMPMPVPGQMPPMTVPNGVAPSPMPPAAPPAPKAPTALPNTLKTSLLQR